MFVRRNLYILVLLVLSTFCSFHLWEIGKVLMKEHFCLKLFVRLFLWGLNILSNLSDTLSIYFFSVLPHMMLHSYPCDLLGWTFPPCSVSVLNQFLFYFFSTQILSTTCFIWERKAKWKLQYKQMLKKNLKINALKYRYYLHLYAFYSFRKIGCMLLKFGI